MKNIINNSREKIKESFEGIISLDGHGIDRLGAKRTFWIGVIGIAIVTPSLLGILGVQKNVLNNATITTPLLYLILIGLLGILFLKKYLFKPVKNNHEVIRSRYRNDVLIISVTMLVMILFTIGIDLVGTTKAYLTVSYSDYRKVLNGLIMTENFRRYGMVIIAILIPILFAKFRQMKLSKYLIVPYLSLVGNTYTKLGANILDINSSKILIKKEQYVNFISVIKKSSPITLITEGTGQILLNMMLLSVLVTIFIYGFVVFYTWVKDGQNDF